MAGVRSTEVTLRIYSVHNHNNPPLLRLELTHSTNSSGEDVTKDAKDGQ